MSDTEAEPVKTASITYPGDCEDVVDNVIGPNSFGEYYQATSATYSAEHHKTRVELKQIRDPRGEGVQWWDRMTEALEDRNGVQI
ncbi:hypothetical protein [Rhodococcoides fascians]|uniref:hypothetical protein n=1 Tax=Rhodococcoides fascians TaxID=1828 RepID=UPI000522EAAC|nr:hypothetical protein [Rhodococcus fascians]